MALPLIINDSLNEPKTIFNPYNKNNIQWYICGPTTYAPSHLGHARTYITFDIIRRILQSYLGYNVTYAMNITDIDDKIIINARKQYVLNKYIESSRNLTDNQLIINLIELFNISDKIIYEDDNINIIKQLHNAKQLLKAIIDDPSKNIRTVFNNADIRELIAVSLNRFDFELHPNDTYTEYSKKYEDQFWYNMQQLNVQPPDIVMRVSEHIQIIQNYIQRIITNGYAYESNGSVYFDLDAFNDEYKYDKLNKNSNFIALSKSIDSDKKNVCDFVLWKKYKPFEPYWDSPWGPGRPGWHIECSAMANSKFDKLDIHSGGCDLRFPHHTNEIAQADAHDTSRDLQTEWCKHWLHSGHLNIDGMKMSKSLKNFITIDDALKKYTARQLRLFFLHHAWDASIDYNDSAFGMIIQRENQINEFFMTVDSMAASNKHYDSNWHIDEYAFINLIIDYQKQCHDAILDNFNFPLVMATISKLITEANIYKSNSRQCNWHLLNKASSYIRYILNIFGLNYKETIHNDNIASVLDAVTEFRQDIRNKSLKNIKNPSNKDKEFAKSMLESCDQLRNTLQQQSIRIEDNRDGSIWKYIIN